jgi:1,4-alpha-glucan branching enzyme
MHLVQILLPMYDADGKRFPQAMNDRVREELTERFGGLTAYVRSPAKGLWKEEEGRTVHDDIVVYEVMVGRLNRGWWAKYREELRGRFAQEDLVIRTHSIERL